MNTIFTVTVAWRNTAIVTFQKNTSCTLYVNEVHFRLRPTAVFLCGRQQSYDWRMRAPVVQSLPTLALNTSVCVKVPSEFVNLCK